MNDHADIRSTLSPTTEADEPSTRRAARTPRTLTALSVAAIGALTLSACGPDDGSDASDSGEEDSAATVSPEDSDDQEGQEDQADASPDETAETDAGQDGEAGGQDGEETAGGQDGDDSTGQNGAAGDEAVYEAVAAAGEEYPDGVFTEFDDEGSYYEFYIYDGETEWEIELDAETFEIRDTEDDGVDDDDRQEAESVEIEFDEALRTAAEEGGAAATDAELDTEDGTVVYEIELEDDTEVYVDVSTGEVVSTG